MENIVLAYCAMPSKSNKILVDEAAALADRLECELELVSDITQPMLQHYMEEAFGPTTFDLNILEETKELYETVVLVVPASERERFPEQDNLIVVPVEIPAIDVNAIVEADDFVSFKNVMVLTEESAEDLFHVLTEKPLTMQQRMKRRIVMRRIKSKLKLARARAMKRTAGSGILKQRARRQAVKMLKKKLAGGKNYDELATSQKIMIDNRVAKLTRVIDNLSRKLLPKVRRDELARKSHTPVKEAKEPMQERNERNMVMLKRFRIESNGKPVHSTDTLRDAQIWARSRMSQFANLRIIDTEKLVGTALAA